MHIEELAMPGKPAKFRQQLVGVPEPAMYQYAGDSYHFHTPRLDT